MNTASPACTAQTAELEWLPFARMHLCRNPFGLLSQEDQVSAAIIDADRWVSKLIHPGTAVQFMGDCGHGKSTHLVALASHFPKSAYVYLPADAKCPAIPMGAPLFIDEAQRLPWLTRRRAFRRGVPIVLGTHCDLSTSLRRAGYKVETVEVRNSTSPERVLQLLNRRIELAKLPTGEPPWITMANVKQLMQRFNRNVREMEHFLYDQFQERAEQSYGKV